MISNSLFLRSAAAEEIQISKSEALRYLHISGEVNSDFEKLYEECLKLFRSAVSYKSVISPVPIAVDGDFVKLDFGVLQSKNLSYNLSSFDRGFVFAATLGSAVDRLISKFGVLSPAKGMVIDAIASAAIEDFCNKINAEFAAGFQTKHRFSPGYGDLSLSVQPDILEFLDAYRRIGISLSENYFMTPSKSVTAIFGIK